MKVTSRPVFLSSNTTYINISDQDILQAELNKEEEYDIVIQYILPTQMVNAKGIECSIGITHMETMRNRQWDNYLQLMDKVFVSSKAEKNCLSKKIREKSYSIGGSILQQPTEIPLADLSSDFRFYFFCDSLETKSGIDALLQTYMSEFTSHENVSLNIYTSNPQRLEEKLDATTRIVGLYTTHSYYPAINIVPSKGIDDSDFLHRDCHCFIDPSGMNGFKTAAAKAMSFGNPVITVDKTSMTEYVNNENGWVVDSSEEILLCPDRPFKDIFTAKESYYMANKISFKKAMRDAFNDRISYHKKSKQAKKSAIEFSVEKQSKAIEDILCS